MYVDRTFTGILYPILYKEILLSPQGLTEGAAGYGGGPDYDDESPEYINTSMDQSLEDLAFKQKGNVYKPFPTLWSQHKVATDPDSSSSDNEEYEEVI